MAILFPITPPPQNPKMSVAAVASVAAGGQATLDSEQITSGKSGKLMQLTVSSNAAFKVEVRTVKNDVPSAPLVVWWESNRGWDFKLPSADFITVDGDADIGFDGFRIVVTNCDPTDTSDFWVTFFYDEV